MLTFNTCYRFHQGSDCVHPFVALQDCIKTYPDAFSEDIIGDNISKKEVDKATVQDYKFIPPRWSVKAKQQIS